MLNVVSFGLQVFIYASLSLKMNTNYWARVKNMNYTKKENGRRGPQATSHQKPVT